MSDQVTTPILSEAVKLGDLYYLSGQIGTDQLLDNVSLTLKTKRNHV